jgi:hypothetical protein
MYYRYQQFLIDEATTTLAALLETHQTTRAPVGALSRLLNNQREHRRVTAAAPHSL